MADRCVLFVEAGRAPEPGHLPSQALSGLAGLRRGRPSMSGARDLVVDVSQAFCGGSRLGENPLTPCLNRLAARSSRPLDRPSYETLSAFQGPDGVSAQCRGVQRSRMGPKVTVDSGFEPRVAHDLPTPWRANVRKSRRGIGVSSDRSDGATVGIRADVEAAEARVTASHRKLSRQSLKTLAQVAEK